MLRITVVESSAEGVRLRVEGRLIGGWVEELRRTCDVHAFCDGIRLTLDLADVSFVDASGIELLKAQERPARIATGLARARTRLQQVLARPVEQAAPSGGASFPTPITK
jgi:hypothetical protein